jgi:hypothetical protein
VSFSGEKNVNQKIFIANIGKRDWNSTKKQLVKRKKASEVGVISI